MSTRRDETQSITLESESETGCPATVQPHPVQQCTFTLSLSLSCSPQTGHLPCLRPLRHDLPPPERAVPIRKAAIKKDKISVRFQSETDVKILFKKYLAHDSNFAVAT